MTDLHPFVPGFCAEWLTNEPERRHRAVEGTLVSADLSGFTALSERLADKGREGAEELTLTVNLCFTLLIEAAEADGGDVLKFGGDALLLLFRGPHHAIRAVRACCRMQRVLGSAALRSAQLKMSVGAHSGVFDLFLVGGAHRELVVCGHEASTVTRLEAAANAGDVLVSRAAASSIDQGWLGPERDVGVPVAQARVPDVEADPAGLDRGIGSQRDLEPLVPAAIREQLAALASAGGEHRIATIAFLELDDVDDRLAVDGAPAMADELDRVIGAIGEAVDRLAVTFLYSDVIANGVKLIVAAGVPVTTGADEEAVLRAVQPLVNRVWPGPLRAGVHRGKVFAGFLGSPTRRTYTVMGDPVNLAARLLGRAAPGQLLVSDDTIEHCQARFATSEVAPFMVKGKSNLIHAHLVGELVGGRNAVWRDEYPLVGRDGELEVLRNAIAGAAGGVGQVVELVGDAGIGKSRLVREVIDDPRVRNRLTTECQPYDGGTAFAGVRPLLRAVCGIDAHTTPDDAGALLDAHVRRVAPELEPWVPLLAIPVGASVEATPETMDLAPAFITQRIHESVVDLLAASLPEPSLLVIEDLYFADDSSMQLLRHIATGIEQKPWALLVTTRGETRSLADDETPCTTLVLSPLEAEASAELAGLAATAAGVTDAELAALSERSGGNPLFVLELVNLSGSGDELPETIERLVATRIDQFEPRDRMLLRHASVLGRVFELALLDELVAASGETMGTAERWVQMGEFVEAHSPSELRFRHALYRDAAYEGLPFNRRRELHVGVGDLLEARHQDGDQDVGLLSLHYWRGARYDKAWRYSVIAGDDARRSHAIVEAIDFYRRALDSTPYFRRVPIEGVRTVSESLGDVLEVASRYDEARDAYDRARRAGEPPRHHLARLLRKLGVLEERRARYVPALRWYGRARTVLGDSADPVDIGELADIELAYAGVRYRQGRLADAVVCAQRAAEHAVAIGDEAALAHAYRIIVGLNEDASADEAIALEALAIYERLGDLVGEATVLNNIGLNALYTGQLDLAADRFARAATLFDRAGDVAGAAMVSNNSGELLVDRGRLDEGEASFERARRGWGAGGYVLGVTVVDINVGRLEMRRGRFDVARDLYRNALVAFEEIGARTFIAETLVRQAECEVLAGEPAAALVMLEAAEGRLDPDTVEPGVMVTRVEFLRVRGCASMQVGDLVAARADLEESLEVATRGDAAVERALIFDALSVLARLDGLGDPAVLKATALDIAKGLGVVALPDFPLPS